MEKNGGATTHMPNTTHTTHTRRRGHPTCMQHTQLFEYEYALTCTTQACSSRKGTVLHQASTHTPHQRQLLDSCPMLPRQRALANTTGSCRAQLWGPCNTAPNTLHGAHYTHTHSAKRANAHTHMHLGRVTRPRNTHAHTWTRGPKAHTHGHALQRSASLSLLAFPCHVPLLPLLPLASTTTWAATLCR